MSRNELRAVVIGAAVVGAVFLVVTYWHYLVIAAVSFYGWRHVTRSSRRRRPRSSWSSLGRTAAMMFAAWNSRWLKPDDVKVTVPRRATTTPDVHEGWDA